MSAGDGFALLWSRILDSSIWDQSAATRVVWITILAMKNREGFVKSTFTGLKRNANVTEEECRVALDIFLAPDGDSSSKLEEGRRLKVVEGGWYVVNHDKYQYSSEEKREYWRRVKAEQRLKEDSRKRAEAKVRGLPLPGEVLYERAAARGDGSEDAVADSVNAELESNKAEMEGEGGPADI